MMMQGIVMKITDRCIVVLCEDGTFRNLPHPPVMPSLGDNLSIPQSGESNQRHSLKRYLKKHWIYAASLVLLLGVIFIYNNMLGSKQTTTLVAIDINPGIELIVNQQGLIDEVNVLNEEAKQLLSGKELVNQDFYEAVRWLFAQAEKYGYLNAEAENKWIWLSIVDLGTGAYSIDPEQIITQDMGYHVEVFTADEQQLEQAKTAELTLNKYFVLELAAEKGIKLNHEQLRSQSILNSLHQAGVDPEALFAKPLQSGKDDSSNELWNSEPTDGLHVKQSTAIGQEEQGEAEQRARGAAGSQPAEPIEEQRTRGDHEAPSQEEQVRAGSLDDNSSARNSSGAELSVQKPLDSSIAKVQERAAADKAEKTPKTNFKTDIQKLKLKVKLADDGEIKVEYENKDGQLEAKVERKNKQSEEKQQGQQAVAFVKNVIKHLKLQEKKDRKIVVSRVISSLNIKQNEWREIEIEVEFTNGSELEFESVNPLKAQKNEKEKEKVVEKAKEREAKQNKKQAKKEAKKHNKDNNDDGDDDD
ncbi:anti-sigma-I factor RsgI family protein [Paenibacillus lentus]|nr:YusW family protein [Paenibacillus lentus]